MLQTDQGLAPKVQASARHPDGMMGFTELIDLRRPTPLSAHPATSANSLERSTDFLTIDASVERVASTIRDHSDELFTDRLHPFVSA